MTLLDASRPPLLDALRQYVQVESPTGDAVALAVMTGRLAGDFAALGAAVTVHPHPTGDHLVCEWVGTGGLESAAPLVFLAHSDTVWPVGTLETMPWRTAGDSAWGPGVFDMKGGIVALQGALGLVVGRAHRPIVLVITADEEIGSPTSHELVARIAETAHAVIGLEPAHPDGALKTSRWGSTRVRISVVGREAHAALDAASGVSAIDELVDRLGELRVMLDDYPSVLCNVGTISGGGRTNVIAGHAAAEIGLRFVDSDTEAEVLGRIGALTAGRPGAMVTVEVLSSRPAWPAGARHDALCDAVARAAALVGQTAVGRPATGAADTNISGALGTPSIDGLGPVGSGAHAVTEQIRVSSLAERAALLASIITTL
jgi:glutamate carboxypeptidase